jgi:enamine deaminase RidA (YjgF/YER057c/UK114 family)
MNNDTILKYPNKLFFVKRFFIQSFKIIHLANERNFNHFLFSHNLCKFTLNILFMEKKPINPWQWQENFGFSQAVEVSSPQQILYCAGQTAIGPEGTALHQDDMRAQVQLALNNLEEVLTKGGYNWANVVRLTIYTTDMDRFFAKYGEVMTKVAAIDPKPAITLLGITRLAFPELMVEIEATAVK